MHLNSMFWILSQELSSMRSRLDDLEKKPASGNGGGASNQQLVKLKAQVKFGEDALKQEQELVKQLQEQLSKQKQVCSFETIWHFL